MQFVPTLVSLNESKLGETVQLLRTGTFYDDRYGKLEITKKILESMIHNFNENTRGVDLAVDYRHEADDIAAGWIKSLELKELGDDTELWAKVDWTPQARKRLEEKEFRYLSAEFDLDYQDNENLKKFGPTLFGAGLTNRPVVKRMQPAATLQEKMNKEKEMELQELTDLVKKLSEDIESLKKDKTKKLEEGKEKFKEGDMPSDSVKDMKKLIVDLRQEVDNLKGQLAEKDQELEMGEKERTFNTILSEGKAVEAQRDAYIKGDMAKFAELSGSVKFDEQGSGSQKSKDKKDIDPADQVMELAEELSKKENIDFDEAVSKVLAKNKELSEKYVEAYKL